MGTPPTATPAFVQALRRSPLPASPPQFWITSPVLTLDHERFTPEAFLHVRTLMLENPNLNSSVLFRADILHDSAGVLQSPRERERAYAMGGQRKEDKEDDKCDNKSDSTSNASAIPPIVFDCFDCTRTLVRRFIPRNQNIDPPLDQTCHFYTKLECTGEHTRRSDLSVLIPHVSSVAKIPWYHPVVRGLAFLYEFNTDGPAKHTGTLSVHFLPFSDGIPASMPLRLERTLLSLVATEARLARKPLTPTKTNERETRTARDNLIPQHIVQNTYARLKTRYASDLINRWAEPTDASKHVFEDLSIAAFLLESWKLMYADRPFPGFVDLACGNGVLVYVLHAEGYAGWGFDARRRKTWAILPPETQKRLHECVCVPQPFIDALGEAFPLLSTSNGSTLPIHSGLFAPDTFIISNHADELTLWTPLLAALTFPDRPLPFLAIPCCSHALSGARYRYPPPKPDKGRHNSENQADGNERKETGHGKQAKEHTTPDLDNQPRLPSQKPGPESPSLLREPGYSAYASLTAKVTALAEEIGFDVQRTLLRIPSTRNIGVVGGLGAYRTRAQVQVRERARDENEKNERKGELARQDEDGKSEARARDEPGPIPLAGDDDNRVTKANGGQDANKTSSQPPPQPQSQPQPQPSQFATTTATTPTSLSVVPSTMSSSILPAEKQQPHPLISAISALITRETSRDGGLAPAARLWVERAMKLHDPKMPGTLRGGAGHGRV